MDFKINDETFKNNITQFSNNVPLKYIFIYYGLWTLLDDTVTYKYLKNGFKTVSKKLSQIEDKSLIDLLE